MRRILKAAAKHMIYLGLSRYAQLRSHHYLHIPNRGSGVLSHYISRLYVQVELPILTLFSKINFILPLTRTPNHNVERASPHRSHHLSSRGQSWQSKYISVCDLWCTSREPILYDKVYESRHVFIERVIRSSNSSPRWRNSSKKTSLGRWNTNYIVRSTRKLALMI